MQTNNSGTEDLLNGGSSNSGNPSDPSNQGGSGNGGNSQPETKLYSTPDGRMVTAEQLVKEHNSLYTDYHQKSQELSKLRTPSNQEPSNSDFTDPKDAALAAELKRLGFVQKADVERTITEKGGEIAQSATKRSISAVKLEEALDDLETDFDGSEGKPKVSKEDVLNFIVKNPTLDLSPLQIARTLYYDDFVRWEARNLGGNPNPQVPTTETHGAQVVNPPTPPVYRFNDGSAYRAAMEILNKAK